MNSGHSETEVVVRGIVVPVSWDVVGNPLGVAILTTDEGEYRIAPRGLGRRLFGYLREEVRARLVLRCESAGETVATIVSFTVVERNGEPQVTNRARPPREELQSPDHADPVLEKRDGN